MKKIIGLLIVLFSMFLITGCGSTSSSNPVATVITPTIVAINPQSGGSGSLVSIQGTGFGSVQGSNYVSYAGVTVTPTSWSDTLITLTIPLNAPSNGSFQITVGGVISNSSTVFYSSSPSISDITPQTVNSVSQVVIRGQYFGTTQGSSYVAFNGQSASVTSWSDTLITCNVPTISGTNSGSVAVVVTLVSSGSSKPSNTVYFNVTNPSIGYITPPRDNIGSVITISGQGFGQNINTVGGYVTIGGLTAPYVSWSDTAIQVRVPSVSSSGSKNVIVNTNGKQLSTYFIVEAPVASSFSPNSPNEVSEGQTLTISGQYFGSSSDVVSRSVSIEGKLVEPVYYSDTSLSFTWPISNVAWTQTKTVTINIGGLSTTILVTAE